VYTLDFPSPLLNPLGTISAYRCYPGLINVTGNVYVFGGRELKTAERLRVAYKEWQPLPDMQHARSGFMPCCAGRDIHLPSTASSQLLWEVFDIVKREYRSLAVPLIPGIYDNSVSFLADRDLIVLTAQKKIGKYNLKSGLFTALKYIELFRCEYAISNLAPVRIDSAIYWVNSEEGKLMKYSVDSDLKVITAL
jgi:hypothetical protein